MKAYHTLAYLTVLSFAQTAYAQNIVGPGGSYTNVFGPPATVNSIFNGALALTATANTQDVGLWTARANGGLRVLGLASSQAQVRMTEDSVQFRAENSGLLGNLGIGAGLAFDWEATLNLDQLGNEILVQSDTIYQITFGADFDNNLSLLGSYGIDVLSGNDLIYTTGASSLADILGLGLFNSERDGTISLNIDTSSTTSGGILGIRFRGGETLGLDVLNLADPTYASFSGFQVTASPVPEPSGMVLVSGAGFMLLLRRRR